MLCKRNGCEILFYWLRRWCSEASASSVLKQPPCCQRSELLYEALSAAALSPAGYVGQALLSVTLSLYLHGKGGCGKARCCAALPQTEQSWHSSPESQRGTPGTWGCGSVTGLPTPAHLCHCDLWAIQDMIQGFVSSCTYSSFSPSLVFPCP